MALTDNIVAYYKLDESSGNASDSVGSNTLVNTSTTYATGKINNGAVFNNSFNSELIAGSNVAIDTITFWVNLNSATSKTIIRSNSPDHTIQGDGSGNILIYDGTNRTTTTPWITGSWAHYAFVYTTSGGTGYDLYINGSFSQKITTGGKVEFRQLGRSGSNSFDGKIDEIGIWSRSLTAPEISDLYNYGVGNQYPFVNVYALVCSLGTFALTGFDLLFTRTIVAVLDYGAFALNGISVNFIKGYGILLDYGSFILTGISARFRSSAWTKQSKPTTAWSDTNKTTTNWTQQNK